MADITSPMYIARQGLSISPKCLSISRDAFSALRVWRRSIAFAPKQFIFCTFAFDITEANSQITHLRAFLLTCSPQPESLEINIMHMSYLEINKLIPLIEVIDRVGCKSLEVDARATALSYEGPPSSSRAYNFSVPRLHLSWIGNLHLNYRRLPSTGWAHLLDHLNVASLHTLTIDGKVPMSALTQFLDRHKHIQSLRFRGISLSTTTPTTHLLHLPSLNSLRGSLPHVLAFLRCLSPPPALQCLHIETVTDLPYATFVHNVHSCLELCRGPLELRIGFHPSEPSRQFTKNLRCIPTYRRTQATPEFATITSICFTVRDISDQAIQVGTKDIKYIHCAHIDLQALCSYWATSCIDISRINLRREDRCGFTLARGSAYDSSVGAIELIWPNGS